MTALWSTRTGPHDAPVVLLVHGGGVGAWMWRDQVAALRDRYLVITPDLPGHDHGADVPFTSADDAVAALAGLLRPVADGREITVVGFSFGAQLAVSLAARHPGLVSRVVVVSALTEPMPLTGPSLGLVRLTAPLGGHRWFARLQARSMFVPDDLFDDYLRTVRSVSTADLVALLSANGAFRIPAAWSDYPGPALLLAGDREPRALVRGMQALHQALPSAELEIVPGAGHGLPLQRPGWFTERLLGWLAREPGVPR
ncbi:alpha/beta fold hydrolase [Promicromonospora sp. NPDC050880]|uniref:alpha/beta fold hydrolase n=1 Tax=Promicromonospora sp. NPDC050880 TaxID=3364406 RepID=UPI00379E9F6C